VLLLISVCVLAAHDHTKHIDLQFIRDECRRIAWIQPEDVISQIVDFSKTLGRLDDLWETKFATPKPETDGMWETHFQPKYNDAMDRIIMLSLI
jgi:hypothetical protein